MLNDLSIANFLNFAKKNCNITAVTDRGIADQAGNKFKSMLWNR